MRERVEIRAGECLISEEAVRIDEGPKQWIRKQYEERPYLVGGTLVVWLAAVVGALSLVGSLFVLDAITDYWFELLMVAVVGQGAVPFVTFLLAMRWSLSLRLAQRRGDYPENPTDAEVVPTGWVESVAFDTFRGYPVAHVRYRDDGETDDGEAAVRPILFERDADAEVERARAAFQSLDVPVESVRATPDRST